MTDFAFGPKNGFAYRLSPWDSYLLQVEDACGRRFTDQRTIDMLYTLYLGDVAVETAVESVAGMQHASIAVRRVIEDLERLRAVNPLLNNMTFEGDLMKHDPKPDPTLRFTAPRAGLARRRRGSSAEWRIAIGCLIAAGGIALLIAAVIGTHG